MKKLVMVLIAVLIAIIGGTYVYEVGERDRLIKLAADKLIDEKYRRTMEVFESQGLEAVGRYCMQMEKKRTPMGMFWITCETDVKFIDSMAYHFLSVSIYDRDPKEKKSQGLIKKEAGI